MNQLTYELMSTDQLVHDKALNFTEIFEESMQAYMNNLNQQKIDEELYGKAVVRYWEDEGGIVQAKPVSHAAVTGIEHYGGSKLLIIGGVITLAAEQGKGHSLKTVEAVCEAASSDEARSIHGHDALGAVCNDQSQLLTTKLGFSAVGMLRGKVLMKRQL